MLESTTVSSKKGKEKLLPKEEKSTIKPNFWGPASKKQRIQSLLEKT